MLAGAAFCSQPVDYGGAVVPALLAVADGRAGAQLLRHGGGDAARARRRRQRHGLAAQPGGGVGADSRRMDVESFALRLAGLSRRRAQGKLRPAATDNVPPSQGAGGTNLRPQHSPRQRHQDRLDIAAGLQAEQRAAVVEQVELDIAAAFHQLLAALLRGPGTQHVAADDARIYPRERLAHAAGEGEIVVPLAAVEIVEEDAADAATLVPVFQEEIFVAPLLEARVIAGIVRRAGRFERGVKILGVGGFGEYRSQIGAAAEPPLGGAQMPRVHVRGRHQRRARMRDQRNSARPEARILRRAGNLAAELGRELAPHRRDVDADLLEHAAMHERDFAAAAALASPAFALEAPRRAIGGPRRGLFVLDALEHGADAVA